ncbi:hypothetical protein RHMOL_Rhmol07G0103000 [Rhododendron molle]|uniref:Uncharacterized protein n=1 Tax=Rhododendron molle TaxID=49168 RepID=A0ACC0N089_RHOML|nr:hypothetical protein RHMOL_Rhmol07G0103000 [Rhododendron molle]
MLLSLFLLNLSHFVLLRERKSENDRRRRKEEEEAQQQQPLSQFVVESIVGGSSPSSLYAPLSLSLSLFSIYPNNFAINRDPNLDRQSRSDVAGKRSTPLLLAATVFPKLKFQFKTQETLSDYSLSSPLLKARSLLHLRQTPIALPPPPPPRSLLFPLLHLTDSPLVAPPQTGKPKPAPTDSPLIAPPTGNPKPAPTTTEARPPPSLLPHSNYQCTNVPEAQDVRAMTG